MQTKKAAPAPRPEGLEDSWLSFLLPECLRPRRTPARALTSGGWVEGSALEGLERVGLLIELDGSLPSLCLVSQALRGWSDLGPLPPDDRIGILVKGARKETCLVQALVLQEVQERGWNPNAVSLFQEGLNTHLILSMFWNRSQDLPPSSIEIWSPELDFPEDDEAPTMQKPQRTRFPLAEQGLGAAGALRWLRNHGLFSDAGLYDDFDALLEPPSAGV